MMTDNNHLLSQEYHEIFKSLQAALLNVTGNPILENITNEYVTTSDFQLKFSNQNNGLSCVHLNIQSLNSKLIDFCNLVNDINSGVSLDVIALSEIWSTNLPYFADILSPYSSVFVPPEGSKVGGVCFFINKNLKFTRLNNIKMLSSDDCRIESLFLDINKNKEIYTIGAVYRHPSGSMEEFIKRTEMCLNSLPVRHETLLFGDFNVNLLNYNFDNTVTRFTDLMLMHNFLPVILLPTRITANSQTLIDHIYVREAAKKRGHIRISAGNLIENISDHLPNFCLLEQKSYQKYKPESPVIRLFSEKNNLVFSEKLSQINWEQHFHGAINAILCCNRFIAKITELFEESFPLKKISLRATKNKPWFTSGLRKSRSRSIVLYKKWLKTKSTEDFARYSTYNKFYKKALKCASTIYYNNQFSLRTNGIKKVWANLNQFLSNKTKNIGTHIDKLYIDGSSILNPEEICDGINKHFCSIGTRVGENLPAGNGNFYQYLGPPSLNSMYLSPVTAEEIYQIIDSMPVGRAPGDDGFTLKLVKRNKPWMVTPLLHIIKLSLSLGQVPDKFKTAKVLPIFKKGDPADPSNYRPISLLSIFEKILEKIVYIRISQFLNRSNFFYKYQFGFRSNHSTSQALIEAIDQCYKNIDGGNFAVAIYIDFEKAFDTVSHDVLLAKCYHYGLRGTIYEWHKSYLTCRQQFTVVNGCSSSLAPLLNGVPQGSILGPLLYLIYVNSIQNISLDFYPRLFADDTNLFLFAGELDELQLKANLALDQFQNWCLVNKLKINVSKTCYIFFKSRRNVSPPLAFHLFLNGQEIEQKSSSKYLGIHIDDDLNWHTHINYIYARLMRVCGILYRIRFFIPNDTVKTIYYALVNSNITYGIEIYANTYYSYIDKLIK